MKRKYIVVLTILSFLLSCERDRTGASESSGLTGTWSWVQTCGGIAGICYTPVSAGYTERIEFTKDSLYRIYRDDILVMETHFHEVRSESIFSPDSVPVIKYDDFSITQSYKIRNHDTLFLSDEVYDGFGHLYVRVE